MYYPMTYEDDMSQKRSKKEDKYIFPVGFYTFVADSFNKKFWDDFCIDWVDTVRILVIAPTGTGKTFLLRRLIDEFSRAGVRNIVINDIKGEMHSSTEPNTEIEKQLKVMVKKRAPQIYKRINSEAIQRMNLIPAPIKNMIFYAPEFSYNENHPYYEKVRPFSLKFFSFSEIQAQTILDIKSNANNQKRVLNYMLKLSKEYAKMGEDKLTQEIINHFRDKIPEYIAAKGSMNTKEKIMASSEVVSVFDRLVYCIERDILDGDYAVSFTEFITELDENNIVFDWSGLTWQELRNAKSEYAAYLSSIVYNIVHAKILDEIYPPICFVADEMQHFLHKDDKNTIKDALEDVFTKGRAYDINAIVALQSGEDIDKIFQHNATYLFFGKCSSPKEIKDIKTIFSYIFEGLENDKKIATRLLQNLDKHEFLAIDKESAIYGVIVAFPPLSMHKTKVN